MRLGSGPGDECGLQARSSWGGLARAAHSTGLESTRGMGSSHNLKSGWMGAETVVAGRSRPEWRGSGEGNNYSDWGTAACGYARICGACRVACFLWTSEDRPPMKDKSKRGRAWARKAEELLAANPVQLEKDISIYRMCWKSKRQSVYAQGARATWTLCQWWVEMTKEEETRRAGVRGGKKWGRSGQG